MAVALLGVLVTVLAITVVLLAWRLHQVEARQATVDARMHQLGLVKEMIDEARGEEQEHGRRGLWVVPAVIALALAAGLWGWSWDGDRPRTDNGDTPEVAAPITTSESTSACRVYEG